MGYAPGVCGEDCSISHPEHELLCAACHLPTPGLPSWKHLGPNLRNAAIAWVQECREAGEGMPECVVASFVPSGACLCVRGECFYLAFRRHRDRADVRMCVPCGSTISAFWRTGGVRAEQYRVFFEDEPGRVRTGDGMLKTKEVITGETDICNGCHMDVLSPPHIGNGTSDCNGVVDGAGWAPASAGQHESYKCRQTVNFP